MNGIFALFKGENGSGKTVASASFPDPIILDLDLKGDAVVRKHYPNRKIPYHQFSDALQAGELLERWQKEGCPFETVIVDSLTSLSYYCIKTMDDFRQHSILDVMRTLKQEQEKERTAKKPSVAKAMTELRGFDYYNAEDSYLKFYVDALKVMWSTPGKKPYNVIITAHVLYSEQANIATGNIVKTRRILTAGQKIAAYVPAQFDDVFHFGTSPGDLFSEKGDRVKHFCFTEAVGDDFAKTAYRLPPKIDFTNASLYEKLETVIKNDSRNLENLSPPPQTEATKAAKPKLNF